MPTWVAGVASLGASMASIPCLLPLLCRHHCWLHKGRLRAVLVQKEGIGTGDGGGDAVGNADPGGGCDDADSHADNTCMARPGK